MPTSLPSILTSAPPELPGLIAASVWMVFMVYPPSMSIGRSLADTMPKVTELENSIPPGLPTAITKSPTAKAS